MVAGNPPLCEVQLCDGAGSTATTTTSALCRDFFRAKAAPYAAEWEAAGVVPRAVWNDAGKAGLLEFQAPARFGGMGIKDFRFNAILADGSPGTSPAI